QIAKLFQEMEQAIADEVASGRETIRGAAVVSTDGWQRPLLAVYGYKCRKQIEVNPADFQQELEIVRAGLPKIGIREILSYICREGCYFMIVVPEVPLETKPSEEDCDQLTEQGAVQFQLLLKRLNDLAWHAWAVTKDVSLPGLVPSRLSRISP